MRTSDATKIASWWTEDAIYIDRSEPTIVGRAGLESMLKGILATMSLTKVSVNKDEISASGDLAYYIGSYEEALQPRQGVPLYNRGRFIFIWKRQADGSWKIGGSVGADLAAAAAAPAAEKDSSKAKGA
jgi:ketosteroid isomerase-like protein